MGVLTIHIMINKLGTKSVHSSERRKDANAKMSQNQSKDAVPQRIMPAMVDLSLASHTKVLEGHVTETHATMSKSTDVTVMKKVKAQDGSQECTGTEE